MFDHCRIFRLTPWYSAVPVGRDTLRKRTQIMCQEARVDGKKTNHSLRATGATQLYHSGVPEKLIQEKTGHRSLEALRVYEHTKLNTKLSHPFFPHQSRLHTPTKYAHHQTKY